MCLFRIENVQDTAHMLRSFFMYLCQIITTLSMIQTKIVAKMKIYRTTIARSPQSSACAVLYFFFFFVSRGIDIDENEFINMLLLLVLLLPLLLLESVNIITLLSALAYVFN